jgi:predicted nucleotidyltransferase
MTPSPTENFSQYERLLVDLAAAGIDFAVVGGVAVSLNGFVRATDDVDILVHDSPENVRKLLDRLATWGEGWARELSVDDFKAQEGSIRVVEDFKLDIFTQMMGRKLEDFSPRLCHFETAGVRIPYLAPEDLIALKESSFRDKDQLDVHALRRILIQRKKES